jgi:hypothetical protein
MSTEADTLRAEIAAAESGVAKLWRNASHAAPKHRASVAHQIKLVEDKLRDMRIKLAGMEDRRGLCPACDYPTPPGWEVCEGCAPEVPIKLQIAFEGAYGIAHARRANQYPPAEIARCDENVRLARLAILSHLKQHGSAIAA